MKNTQLPIIGSNVVIKLYGREVPAKVDTGADSSSIWASHIRVDKEGTLKFRLFGEGSPFYSGKVVKRTSFKVAVVRSATGEEQIRFRTYFPVKVGDRKIRILFNLSDRSNNNFPVLLGRRSISGKFLVDVTKTDIPRPSKIQSTRVLQKEVEKNPRKFYLKYVKTKHHQTKTTQKTTQQILKKGAKQ